MRRKAMLAREFLAELASNFEYRRRMREQDAARARARDAVKRAHAEVLAALRSDGVRVSDVTHLARPEALDDDTIVALAKVLSQLCRGDDSTGPRAVAQMIVSVLGRARVPYSGDALVG